MNDTTAILLMTYGTPEGPEGVEPFLYNIFADPDIIELPWYAAPLRPWLARKISRGRAEEVRHNYSRLPGGRSPLNELTAEQGRALVEKLLPHGRFEAFLGMRYAAPRTEATLRMIADQGFRRVVLLPMFPQYARATTRSAIRDFWGAARRLNLADRLDVHAVCCFPENPLMVEAMADDIEAAVADLSPGERAVTPFLFSAHGLPQSAVDTGDPYQQQVERTVAAVVSRLRGPLEVTVCYQSRVGKQEWLKPYTDKVIETLIERKVPRIVIYPVAFITEHSETLFELDLLYGDPIRDAGIELRRVRALGTHPKFIQGLASEVMNALAGPPMSNS